jgi:hypothetical protein
MQRGLGRGWLEWSVWNSHRDDSLASIAAVRPEIWEHQISIRSRRNRDMKETLKVRTDLIRLPPRFAVRLAGFADLFTRFYWRNC